MTIKDYLERDEVILVKANGDKYEDVKVGILSDVILSAENKPFEVGDTINRTLPNQLEESYSITQVNFMKGTGKAIPDHYSMAFNKNGIPTAQNNLTQSITVTGDRVYLNSTDNSENHYHNIENDSDVFIQALSLVKKIEDPNERQRIETVINEMKDLKGDSNGFYSKYKEFISLGSNHMGLLAPVVPALIQYLP